MATFQRHCRTYAGSRFAATRFASWLRVTWLAVGLVSTLATSAQAVFNGVWTQIAPAGPVPAPRRDMGSSTTRRATGSWCWVEPMPRGRCRCRSLPLGTAFHPELPDVRDRPRGIRRRQRPHDPGQLFFAVYELDLSTLTGWQLVATSGTPPPGRTFFASTHDVARNRLILFGGGVAPILGDLWALSLTGVPTWSRILPSGRDLHRVGDLLPRMTPSRTA
jgi:hypothetical protein